MLIPLAIAIIIIISSSIVETLYSRYTNVIREFFQRDKKTKKMLGDKYESFLELNV